MCIRDSTVTGSGNVAIKDVGVDKNIVDKGTLALAGTDAGNYNLVNRTLTITPLDTNISGTRVYDTTTTASSAYVNKISTVLTGDTVTVTGSGNVATKDVGVDKNIVDKGTLALAGTDAGNYNLVNRTLTITPLDTNVSGTRVYDATTTASSAYVNKISTVLTGDTVTVTGSGNVATKD